MPNKYQTLNFTADEESPTEETGGEGRSFEWVRLQCS